MTNAIDMQLVSMFKGTILYNDCIFNIAQGSAVLAMIVLVKKMKKSTS